jgi:hypothetical protein
LRRRHRQTPSVLFPTFDGSDYGDQDELIGNFLHDL